MNKSEQINDLAAALAAAQAELRNPVFDSQNPHFKSKYADLAEVLNTVRPVFSENGLSIIQSTEFDGALVSVTTTIAHKDGGYVSSKASCVPSKTDAQGVGSATTYLRRYSLASACGVAQEDDDGNSSAHNGKPVAKITEKQEIELSDYIEATNTDRAKMLAYFKVKSLSELSSAQAVQAMNMIKSKQKDAA